MHCLSLLQYNDLYNDNRLLVMASFLSPARFFVETMVVSDQRCLPQQTGFTEDHASALPLSSFDVIGTAQLDRKNVVTQTCGGWYWGSLRMFMMGLAIRLFSALLIHLVSRNKQCKPPVHEIIQGKMAWFQVVLMSVFTLTTIIFLVWLVLY